jgi:hypothetical protein
VKVSYDDRARSELHEPDAPGQPLAEVQLVTVKQGRFADELTRARLQNPFELHRQAPMTGLPGRVLNGQATDTLL